MLNTKIVILVALGLGSAASFEVNCDPGDIWKVECNTCICTRGGVPKCTANNCHPDAYHVTSTLGSCKPLSRWRVDCNICTCSEYGAMSCTNNICDANELTSNRFRRQAAPSPPSRDACKPGVAWKDDCNRCFCRENGKAECTQLLCFPLDMPERKRRDVDVERASFKNAFDYAMNHPFGEGFDATYDVFGGEEEKKAECVPVSSWYDPATCNDCFCSQSGIRVCMNNFNNCVPQTGRPKNPGIRPGGWSDTGQWHPRNWTPPGEWTSPRQWLRPGRWSPRGQWPPQYQNVGGVQEELRFKRLACTEGETWKEGCNSCYCSQEGTPACTRKLCLPEEQTSQKREERSTATCTEGKSWKEGCNTCYCTKQGTPACTKKLCLPEEQPLKKREQRETTCRPGTRWMEDCNQCFCPNGTPSCSNRRCSATSAECKPGTTWNLDCNTCHCTDDGQAACTLKGCPSQTQFYPGKQKREVKRCQPGKKWKDDCNDCVCTHTGYAACTLKACDSQTYIVPNRKTREVKKCQPGKKWKDDCNDCVCTHTGYPSCTLKACDSQTYIVPNRKTREVKKCQPGKKWKDECNDCVCTHTGYPSCTLKACPSQPQILSTKQKRQTTSACKPGTRWNDGCNNCFCSENGFPACTLKLCITCKPGTSWKDDCNNCFCSETGFPACTYKACASQTQFYPGTASRPKRQTQSCTPGSKWKEGCNTCTCLNTGKGACTRRLCRRRRDTGSDVSECRPAAKMCGSTSFASESQTRKRDGGKLRGRGRCTPGSTWVQNCSQCYCDEQNNVECIPEDSCSDDQATNQGRKDEGPKGRGRCEPGSTWEIASRRGDWCNLCACDANGNMNCSIRPCQKTENMSKHESETRKKRATRTSKKSERWCKPGDMYYFTCDVCPCGLKGITGCQSRTCRDRAL